MPKLFFPQSLRLPFSLGLTFSIALLVAFRAGKIAGEIHSLNLEEKVDGLAISVLQEKIVDQLSTELRVYRDTTESVTLPLGVNLQEVATRSFFSQREHSMSKRHLFRPCQSEHAESPLCPSSGVSAFVPALFAAFSSSGF